MSEKISTVLTATLTLLALIIGFSFSMAVSRYDQRKDYEEEEANAIGTEYVRLDFLTASDAAKIRDLLTQYLDHRLLFYTTHDSHQLEQIDRETSQLQSEMWSAVRGAAAASVKIQFRSFIHPPDCDSKKRGHGTACRAFETRP